MLDGDKKRRAVGMARRLGVEEGPGQRSRRRQRHRDLERRQVYYVAAWGSQSFLTACRANRRPQARRNPPRLRVDNIRWARDGSLYAAGQTGTREVTDTATVIVKINPETLAVREVYRRRDDATFRFGTRRRGDRQRALGPDRTRAIASP
jgi:hypothetical protein